MKSRLLVLAGCSLAALSTPALAQDAPPTTAPEARTDDSNVLRDIVVTAARKRSEAVQSVPLAITALNATLLERNQVSSIEDLGGLAPNLSMNPGVASVSQVNIFLRGFGSDSNDPSIDPPIAVIVDGVSQPTFSGNLVDLFDVDTVEIQRGPQGTLLGKNAPTGALVVTSRRPTGKFGGAVQLDYQRFDRFQAKARMDIPLIADVLAANVSASHIKGGNFVHNNFTGKTQFGGEDANAFRASLLFTPGSAFRWYVSARAEIRRDPQAGIQDISYVGANGPLQLGAIECTVFGHCTPTGPNINNAGMTAGTSSNTYYLTSQMDYALAAVTLTSVTGYINDKHVNRQDSDGEPEAVGDAIDDPAHYTQISEEFRIASTRGGGLDLGGKLDWVVGGYFSSFRYEDSQNLNILGSILSNNQRGTSRSYALFGHATYGVTDRLSLSLGVRQTWDHKTHNYISTAETTRYVDTPASWKNFSVEAGAQYKLGANRLVYFRYGQGYRGGGFQGLPSPGGTGGTYNPETVETFELGLKADWFDQHLRVNLALFDSAYHGLQRNVLKSLPIAPFFQQIIQNAASARTKGVELEVTAVPLPGLTLNGTLGYIDPRFKDFVAAIIPGQPPTDNSGFPFPFTSKWTTKLGATYSFSLPGRLGFSTFNVDWNYRSSFSAANLPYPAAQVDGFGLLNASLRFEDPSRRYSLTLYGRNITNKIWRTQVLTVPGQVAPFFITQASKPVVYGATLGFKF